MGKAMGFFFAIEKATKKTEIGRENKGSQLGGLGGYGMIWEIWDDMGGKLRCYHRC